MSRPGTERADGTACRILFSACWVSGGFVVDEIRRARARSVVCKQSEPKGEDVSCKTRFVEPARDLWFADRAGTQRRGRLV